MTGTFAIRLLTALALTIGALSAFGQAATGQLTHGAYDFEHLQSTLEADRVDYFTGDWSFSLLLTTVAGSGDLSWPLALEYGSGIAGPDRLLRGNAADGRATYTLNQPSWAGLGWNLTVGAVKVIGGYNTTEPGQGEWITNNPHEYDLALVLPGGYHPLIRQKESGGANASLTNRFFMERRQFWDIRWNDQDSLTSTWTATDLSGNVYTFGPAGRYGTNLTTEAMAFGSETDARGTAVVVSGWLNRRFVYQWNLASIRDPQGNAVYFRYQADRPVTTVRTNQERSQVFNSFQNSINARDLDPRMEPVTTEYTVVKTTHTSHLAEILFHNATGDPVRRVTFTAPERSGDLPLAGSSFLNGNKYYDFATGSVSTDSTIGQVRIPTAQEMLTAMPTGNLYQSPQELYHPFLFRSLDGIETTRRLRTITVDDGAGNAIVTIDFAFDSTRVRPEPYVNAGSLAEHQQLKLTLLASVTIKGKGRAPLPSYAFGYNPSAKYRLTSVKYPTGRTMAIAYERATTSAHARPDSSYLAKKYADYAYRVSRREVDDDGDAATSVASTRYVYPAAADLWRFGSGPVEAVTYPWVEEHIADRDSTSYGKIRRDFVSKADVELLGLASASTDLGRAQRRMWRGLLEEETRYAATGGEVGKLENTWAVDTAGPFNDMIHHGGARKQSFWVRRNAMSETTDGATATTRYRYNRVNGLVEREEIPSYRATETFYPLPLGGAEDRNQPYAWSEDAPSLGDVQGDSDHHRSPTGRARVWTRANGQNNNKENLVTAVYETDRFRITGPRLAVAGTVGLDEVSGAATDLSATARVEIVWDAPSSPVSIIADEVFAAPAATVRMTVDTTLVVPDRVRSAYMRVTLHSSANRSAAPTDIRTYAEITGIENVTAEYTWDSAVASDSTGVYGWSGRLADLQELWAEATGTPNVVKESTLSVRFRSTAFDVTDPYLRVRGKTGLRDVSGPATGPGGPSGSVAVNLIWPGLNNRSTHVGGFSGHTENDEFAFDEEIAVPQHAANVTPRALIEVTISALAPKPTGGADRWHVQGYAGDIEAVPLPSPASDPEYEIMTDSRRIWDKPASVTVKDGGGSILDHAEYDYATNFKTQKTYGGTPSARRLEREVLSFTEDGRPIETRDAAGTVATTVWGYGRFAPVATFANARASQASAYVFDDYRGAAALLASPDWSSASPARISLADGVLRALGSTNDQALRLTVPALGAGVFECDVMTDSSAEHSAITLSAGTTTVIGFDLKADGTFGVHDNGSRTPRTVHTPWRVNRWHHVRLEWDASANTRRWFARVNGIRYPKTGYYDLTSGNTPDRVLFRNGAGAGRLFVDNVRVYPAAALPTAFTTYDPANLAVTAMQDANGVTRRYYRDPLGSAFLSEDGMGRITARRSASWSRHENADAYAKTDPNRIASAAYVDPKGYPLRNQLIPLLEFDAPVTVRDGEEMRYEADVIRFNAGLTAEPGSVVRLRARERLVLGPETHLKPGADFKAGIDTTLGVPAVTSGTVDEDVLLDGRQAMKIGTDGTYALPTSGAPLAIRADVYVTTETGGTPVVLGVRDSARSSKASFEIRYDSGSDRFRIYEDGVRQASDLDDFVAPNRAWYVCEIDITAAGDIFAAVMRHDNFADARKTQVARASRTGFPSGWRPELTLRGSGGRFHVAGLYLGASTEAMAYFDASSRPTQQRVITGGRDLVTHTAYNGLGRPVSATLPVGVTSSRTASVTAPTTNRTTRTTYLADPLMRTATVTAPGQTASSSVRYGEGDRTRVSAENRYETVTDELGKRVTSHFDRWGQLAVAIADSGGTDETVTRFAYDGLGRLVRSTAPMGDATTYAYDVHGDMTSRTQPDAGATKYKYDSRHNVRFSQNAQQAASGKVSYFTYDRFSRVIRSGEVTRVFASLDANTTYTFETDAASWTSRYVYDVDDLDEAGGSGASRGPGMPATWPVGRPVRIEQNTDADAAAEVTARIAYDHEGRVIHRRVTIGTLPAKDVFYTYDLAGKVAAMVYPDGSKIHYAYDAAGRLAGVTDAEGNALATYAYDHDGRMTSHAVGGALATGAYGYNLRDWVSGIDYPGRFTLSQAYDAVGNVTSQNYRRATTETRKAATYTYDGLHRLKTFSLDATHARSYAYDDNGNITRVVTGSDTTTYAYSRDTTPNRLDSLTVAGSTDTFLYDANGSATSVAGTALTYDHRGLVTGYGAYGYTIDAEGFRVKKTGGGRTVYYVRGAGGSVLATYDTAGNLTANYVYAGGDRLARVAGGVVSYYLKDHLGSTRTLLSSSGTSAATYDYWPYGEVLATGGTDATPFKFTGHERDSESGLDFMQYRSYRSGSLRFLQTDPLGLKDPEFSYYVYTGSNPVNRIDHYGLESSEVNGGGEVDIYEMEPVIVWGQRHYNHRWFDRAWGARFDVEIQGSPTLPSINLNRTTGLISNTSSYVSAGLGAVEFGIRRYGNLSTINNLIESSSGLRGVYRNLGATTRVLGNIGIAGSVLGLYYDFHAMQTGKISVGRFTYVSTGFGASVATGFLVGTSFGGPYGAVAGTAVGLVFWGGETAYDHLYPKVKPKLERFGRDIESGIGKVLTQWYPGYPRR
ncbi:MAG: DUF6443 domain-containing protein [Gemmatimonadetes bacterium]|nr:DUF6443 domain-containing protein [Gemmatimonadota bacterium]